MIRTLLVLLCAASCSKSDTRARAQQQLQAGSGAAQPSCAVEIVLDEKGDSIATAAGACRAPRVDGKPDKLWLEAELGALRATLTWCTADAVVVAETGPYQELITVMDIAVKEGFIDVNIGDRSDLTFPATGSTNLHCKLPKPPPPTPVARPAPPPPEAPVIPPLTPDEVRRLEEQKPLQIPVPDTKETLQQAPVIIVTKTEVTFQGQLIAAVDDVAKDPQALKLLAERLAASAEATKHALAHGDLPRELVQACEDAKRGLRPVPGQICPVGLAILQADESTDMRVINSVIHTAKAQGFDNLLFAVKNL
jgi:biopolymer transport protein ExbD